MPFRKNLIPSVLILEPIDLEEDMKITEERKAQFHLIDAGFTDDEIDYIKKKCLKEGIRFSPLTFASEDLNEVKIELREHMKKKKFNKLKEIINIAFDLNSKNKFMY
tara:strand:- start:142 stop:462 length:321 start_codon:yes stop_codon:yes gene_type:complete